MTVIDDLADRTDADLIGATRAGDDQAYAELWTRHHPAALRQARALTRNDPEDLVSEAFSRILAILRAGGGPDTAFRPYLLTSVRRLSIDRAKSAQQREVPTGEESDLDLPTQESLEGQHVEGVDAALAWSAWTSLPEPTRALLWHAVVEEERPADIARTLGVSANSVASRTKRARERLRQAYLSEHAAATDDEECRRVRARLGSYVRRAVSPRGSRQIRDHLHTCRECRAAYAEVRNIDSMVLGVVATIITGAAALYAISRVLAPTTAAAATIASTSGAAGGTASGAAAGAGTGAGTASGTGSSAGGAGSGAAAGTGSGGAGAADKSLPSRVAEVASTPAGRVLIGLTAAATVAVVAATAFARQPPPTPSSTDPVERPTAAAPTFAPTSAPPTSSEPSVAPPSRKATSSPAATAPAQQALNLNDSGGVAPPSQATVLQPSTRTASSPRSTSAPSKAPTRSPSPKPTKTRTPAPSPTATASPTATPTLSPTPSATPTPTEPSPSEEPTEEPTEPVETICKFSAETDQVYRARLEVPDGFLLISVKDLHDGEPFEHLDEQSRTFNELVREGPLTVVVQRIGEGEGDLRATFTTPTGRPLGGGGTCALN